MITELLTILFLLFSFFVAVDVVAYFAIKTSAYLIRYLSGWRAPVFTVVR
jgi:hypothetical protein